MIGHFEDSHDMLPTRKLSFDSDHRAEEGSVDSLVESSDVSGGIESSSEESAGVVEVEPVEENGSDISEPVPKEKEGVGEFEEAPLVLDKTEEPEESASRSAPDVGDSDPTTFGDFVEAPVLAEVTDLAFDNFTSPPQGEEEHLSAAISQEAHEEPAFGDFAKGEQVESVAVENEIVDETVDAVVAERAVGEDQAPVSVIDETVFGDFAEASLAVEPEVEEASDEPIVSAEEPEFGNFAEASAVEDESPSGNLDEVHALEEDQKVIEIEFGGFEETKSAPLETNDAEQDDFGDFNDGSVATDESFCDFESGGAGNGFGDFAAPTEFGAFAEADFGDFSTAAEPAEEVEFAASFDQGVAKEEEKESTVEKEAKKAPESVADSGGWAAFGDATPVNSAVDGSADGKHAGAVFSKVFGVFDRQKENQEENQALDSTNGAEWSILCGESAKPREAVSSEKEAVSQQVLLRILNIHEPPPPPKADAVMIPTTQNPTPPPMRLTPAQPSQNSSPSLAHAPVAPIATIPSGPAPLSPDDFGFLFGAASATTTTKKESSVAKSAGTKASSGLDDLFNFASAPVAVVSQRPQTATEKAHDFVDTLVAGLGNFDYMLSDTLVIPEKPQSLLFF